MSIRRHLSSLHRSVWVVVGCLTAAVTIGASAGPAVAASKSPIKIFVYGDMTQPAPEPLQTYIRNIPEAAVKAIDATGGINGAKVQMTFCDSKSDPNVTLACAHQALAGHYSALIEEGSSYGSGGADALLAASKLPLFYAIPTDAAEINAPNAVCPTSTTSGTALAISLMAKELNISKLSLAYLGAPSFATLAANIKTGMTKAGLTVPASVPFTFGTTDFSSTFAQAMSGGAGGLWFANFGATLPSSVKEFLQAYPGKKLILQILEADSLQQIGNVNRGVIYYPLWTQPISSGVPGAKQFVATLKKYDKATASADISDDYIPLYLSVQLFAGIADTIHGKVDAASVLKATKTAKNVAMGGLVPNYSGSNLGKTGLGTCVYQPGIVPVVDSGETFKTVKKTGQFLNTKTGNIFTVKS